MPTSNPPQDVTSTIVRIDAAARGVNAVFQQCPALDPGTQQAWSAWYAGWKQFTATTEPADHLLAAYENDIAGWQADADQICNAHVPVLVPQLQQNTNAGRWESVLSTARWIAGAVIVALLVPPIVESVKEFHAARRGRKVAAGR